MVIPLHDISPGETVHIVWVGNDAPAAGRLQDLGFEAGAVISCVLQKPAKNIAAYLVRNAVIALRETDSRKILVSPLKQTDLWPLHLSAREITSQPEANA